MHEGDETDGVGALGDEGKRHALYEPIHCSAPEYLRVCASFQYGGQYSQYSCSEYCCSARRRRDSSRRFTDFKGDGAGIVEAPCPHPKALES
jgi:hypothetical protein